MRSKTFSALLQLRNLGVLTVRYMGTAGLEKLISSRFPTKWTSLQKLHLVSLPIKVSSATVVSTEVARDNYQLCNSFEAYGFQYLDVANYWMSLSFTNPYQIRWTTLRLLAESQQHTVENLMKKISEEGLCGISSTPTVPECISALATLLKAQGVCEKALSDLIDKLNSHEISNFARIRQLLHSVEISQLLMRYINSHPDTIISEYSCLSRINIAEFLTYLQEIRDLGLASPNTISNYLTGSYLHPSKRGFQSASTKQVLDLLGLSRDDAAKNKLHKYTIMYMLQTRGYQAIEQTFDYLLSEGYLRRHIASSPLVLAFSKQTIKGLLAKPPKQFDSQFNATTDKVEKLNLIFKRLDQMQDWKITNYYLSKPIILMDNEKTPYRW